MTVNGLIVRRFVGLAAAATLVWVSGCVSPADQSSQSSAVEQAEAQAQESWREAMVGSPAPADGCFHASYPGMDWSSVECVAAPNRPFTVGNGKDFAAKVSGLISQTVGSFPTVSGVTSEHDGTSKNVYSIQLNSNLMSTAACKDGSSDCQAWEQFVYSAAEESLFMQYWLINYGNTCPSGWNSAEGSCYKNSAAGAVPQIAITSLSGLKMSGKAVKSGNDTLSFSNGTEAFSTSGKDSVTDLATAWTESEFNIVGDGGGTKAVFDTAASVTVKVAVTDGSSSAPTCVSNAGTTGETNSLTLGKCTASGGSPPYIEFTETK